MSFFLAHFDGNVVRGFKSTKPRRLSEASFEIPVGQLEKDVCDDEQYTEITRGDKAD
jgi:hypothetical protein